MKVGDFVKVAGGTLRPPWYGEHGVIITLVPKPDVYTHGIWYEGVVSTSGSRIIRDDMLVLLNENR